MLRPRGLLSRRCRNRGRMPQLTGAAFKAVKGVFLIGDPEHRRGLAGNVDQNGGTTTLNASGLSATLRGISSNWVSNTLDMC